MTDQGAFPVRTSWQKCDYFFPESRYFGCTKEATAFSALQAEFEAANTLVIGISKDSAEKQVKFREKYGLTCLLGADTETLPVKHLASGSRNQCMAANIWAFSGRPLS